MPRSSPKSAREHSRKRSAKLPAGSSFIALALLRLFVLTFFLLLLSMVGQL